jgi:hypothetical protein
MGRVGGRNGAGGKSGAGRGAGWRKKWDRMVEWVGEGRDVGTNGAGRRKKRSYIVGRRNEAGLRNELGWVMEGLGPHCGRSRAGWRKA